jgi:hypothetical protein
MSSNEVTVAELQELGLTKADLSILRGMKQYVNSKFATKKASPVTAGKKSDDFKTLAKFVASADQAKQKIVEETKDQPDELNKALKTRRGVLRSAMANIQSKDEYTYNDAVRLLKAVSAMVLDLPKPEAPTKGGSTTTPPTTS